MMSILANIFGGGIVDSVGKIIDNLNTSDAEKLDAKTKLLALQAEFASKAFDYEAKIQSEAAQNVRAEAAGNSPLQRNWRPLMMLMFGSIIAWNYLLVPITQMFGAHIAVLELPPDLWALLKIGIGGYTVGRSAEKIVPATIAALKSKESV